MSTTAPGPREQNPLSDLRFPMPDRICSAKERGQIVEAALSAALATLRERGAEHDHAPEDIRRAIRRAVRRHQKAIRRGTRP